MWVQSRTVSACLGLYARGTFADVGRGRFFRYPCAALDEPTTVQHCDRAVLPRFHRPGVPCLPAAHARKEEVWGTLLEELYEELLATVKDCLKRIEAAGGVTIALDAWENITREHIVNFLIGPDGAAIFLDSVCTGAAVQSADNQAACTKEVIERIGTS